MTEIERQQIRDWMHGALAALTPPGKPAAPDIAPLRDELEAVARLLASGTAAEPSAKDRAEIGRAGRASLGQVSQLIESSLRVLERSGSRLDSGEARIQRRLQEARERTRRELARLRPGPAGGQG